MKAWTVKQLAKLAGVSVRTLHHYDALGLLTPAHVGQNQYRYYGKTELQRLQQILIYRELDFPLAQIAELIDAEDHGRLQILQAQRQALLDRANHFAYLIETIDRTISDLKGERKMKSEELYAGVVSPEKQAEFEVWMEERYGPSVKTAVEHSKQHMAKWTDADRQAQIDKLEELESGFVNAMLAGVLANSSKLDPLLDRHRAWVANGWGRSCPPVAYGGLADAYETPDFQSRYEAVHEGLAEYLCTAMRAYAQRKT